MAEALGLSHLNDRTPLGPPARLEALRMALAGEPELNGAFIVIRCEPLEAGAHVG